MSTDSAGAQKAGIAYYPYGGMRASGGALGTDRKFTGQRLDGSGLYYYGARYYDAGIGQFISADTMVQAPDNPQSLNRYAYAANNPLRYVDPSGLTHESMIDDMGFEIPIVHLGTYATNPGPGNTITCPCPITNTPPAPPMPAQPPAPPPPIPTPPPQSPPSPTQTPPPCSPCLVLAPGPVPTPGESYEERYYEVWDRPPTGVNWASLIPPVNTWGPTLNAYTQLVPWEATFAGAMMVTIVACPACAPLAPEIGAGVVIVVYVILPIILR